MVSIGGGPHLFTQGKSTGEFALLYDYLKLEKVNAHSQE